MRSDRRRSGASRDTLTRTLGYHERRGAVETWSPPGDRAGSTWRIRLAGQPDPLELTASQVFALCCGLVAAELAYSQPEQPAGG